MNYQKLDMQYINGVWRDGAGTVTIPNYNPFFLGERIAEYRVATRLEAVAIANASEYGLSGAVHTSDVDRGVRVARRIDAGMVHVNDASISRRTDRGVRR